MLPPNLAHTAPLSLPVCRVSSLWTCTGVREKLWNGSREFRGPEFDPGCPAQPDGLIVPISTRRPDEAGLPFAPCSVTVRVRNFVIGTPDHSVTLRPSLNVPTGTRTPAGFLTQAW